MSPLAQAIVALLEKLAEEELPVIASWIEGRLAPAAPAVPAACFAFKLGAPRP